MTSREEYGVLGLDGGNWPQMAGMIPVSDVEVLLFFKHKIIRIPLTFCLLLHLCSTYLSSSLVKWQCHEWTTEIENKCMHMK